MNHPLYVEVGLSYPEARKRAIAEFERVYVKALLERTGGNVSRGAREAQMDRVYLHRLIRKQKQRAHGAEK
jgi:DNA-binding NtrC family response regulator